MKVLVTGANRGLGLALVQQGLAQGHIMFAAVRSVAEQHIKELQQLKAIFEGQLRIIHMDVTNEKSVKQAADAVKWTDQYLDVVINNAAVLNERESTIEELDIHACSQAFDVNTLGPLRVVKHFFPLLKVGIEERVSDTQAILNISSEAGSITNTGPLDYPYGMSKAALNMLTVKLKRYLQQDDIAVISIHPGWMQTDMGGNQAPKDPNETAENLYTLLKKGKNNESFSFVDDTGKQMSL
ncbi:SDR family oxidoreductase [Gracilibacillus caseinilyticus]|uniref:SDR family oxidoreductase n=1 Tax=Gracilibacillus caseinilyticus TaxID=2932256 RepID=A0ABY4EQF5_9BACI|nr:SDR family oxidoreductase [Gracilibacillus caseinilyticus]UOQ46686.1 SDR family oxidoreductase [Gracilibacillus caseinilyticus]